MLFSFWDLDAMLIGIITSVLAILNTIFWCTPLYVLFFLKILIPYSAWQQVCYRYMCWLGNSWIKSNNLLMDLTLNIEWDLPKLEGLSTNGWYFIISNHQSWSDIIILQKIYVEKVPFIRFFIKRILLWLPVINVSFLAYDFPVMRRYPKEKLLANPELRKQDLIATQKACEKFKLIPVSILNFLEGTRFTPKKHKMQHSPYPHLLNPKAGGFAFAINAMDNLITTVLDTTIIYPEGRKTFWDFLCGKVKKVIVKVTVRQIPPELLSGNYTDDEHYRTQFKAWIQKIWEEKEVLLTENME
jgi:1-acyl-sn-glycerol-3-phosphate acyltransferase